MPSPSPNSDRRPISIVLADHQPFTRSLLADHLARFPDLNIVAEVADATAALVACAQSPYADILLLRSDLPGYSPFAALRTLRLQSLPTKIAILFPTVLDSQLDEALNGHTNGFFSFEESPQELLRGLRQMMTHGSFRAPSVQNRIITVSHHPSSRRQTSPLATLTTRERDILRLIAEGLTQKQIASQIGLAAKTIDNHAGKVMTKLGIHNRVLLTRYAIREGLVTVDDPAPPLQQPQEVHQTGLK